MDTKITFFILLLISSSSLGTLSKSDSKKAKKVAANQTKKEQVGPVSKSVYEKGLVTSKIGGVSDILNHHGAYHKDFSLRRSDLRRNVLGYVTPWNSKGYEVARTFSGAKMNMIAPIWLQLVPDNAGYKIEGKHDIDSKWMRDLKKNKNDDILVLPRILFDRWTGQDYVKLFSDPSRIVLVSGMIADLVATEQFDGVVLELWSQLGGQAKRETKVLLNKIGQALGQDKTFVLVIPPPVYHGDVEGPFDGHDMDELAERVDFFSLMTYDYSNPQRPGPNAPIEWMRKCVQLLDPEALHRHKILMGINFYGFDYSAEGGKPIVGREYVQLLREAKSAKFKWDPQSQEHFAEVKQGGRKHTVFYPSLHSVEARLLLAKEMDVGVAIWEIGQGLDYFYDLL